MPNKSDYLVTTIQAADILDMSESATRHAFVGNGFETTKIDGKIHIKMSLVSAVKDAKEKYGRFWVEKFKKDYNMTLEDEDASEDGLTLEQKRDEVLMELFKNAERCKQEDKFAASAELFSIMMKLAKRWY